MKSKLVIIILLCLGIGGLVAATPPATSLQFSNVEIIDHKRGDHWYIVARGTIRHSKPFGYQNLAVSVGVGIMHHPDCDCKGNK